MKFTRSKIICTIGPATNKLSILKKLNKAGMNVARINMSHATHKSAKAVIDRIKKQRLAEMENGQRFYKYNIGGGGRDKGKEIYCKLDASHTTLHHKQINEKQRTLPPFGGKK